VPLSSILLIAGAALSVLWLLLGYVVLRSGKNVPALAGVLARGSASRGPGGAEAAPPLPTLSVVLTARDERARIERAVRSVLTQDYPGLEIVAVDDRSTDGTTEILERLAAGAPGRLDVVHVRALPDGWLGKCHACNAGAARAMGDWILFMDGDVELLSSELLSRVVALTTRDRLDHVALIPDSRPMSRLQAGLMAVFAQMYLAASRAYEMHRDLPRGGGGIGAFNLVRRAAYDRIGGHTLLRFDLADDFKLGRLLKESGARQRFYDAGGLVGCPWHEGALNVVRGLEKNFFAGFDYSLAQLGAFTLVVLALTFGPAIIAVLGRTGAATVPLLIQTCFILAIAARQSPRLGAGPWTLAVLSPISILLLLAAAWNSAVRTLLRGGVLWRGRFHRLAELRAGLVRAGVGRRIARAGS
jgi:glycosyl transferase family 2